MTAQLVQSTLDAARAVLDQTVPAGEPWMGRIQRGQVLRILDLEGNQAVDTLFYSAADPEERYSLTHTIQAQGALYLGVGTRLMSNLGRPMLTIVADTCGRHDTLGGACACESNMVRYGIEKRFMHSCRDNYMRAIAHDSKRYLPRALGKRDLPSNINFFMNVPVTPEGGLTFEDGISAPGKYVELRAEMDVVTLVSNCPQLNKACNAFNPTPVRMLFWDGAGV